MNINFIDLTKVGRKGCRPALCDQYTPNYNSPPVCTQVCAGQCVFVTKRESVYGAPPKLQVMYI